MIGRGKKSEYSAEHGDPTVRGASYVEAAISIPLFLVFILGFIDLCRGLLTYVILQHAAQQAVDFASKVEVEVETTQSACALGGSTGGAASCRNYKKRLEEIVASAVGRASVVASPVADAPIRLVRFRHYDAGRYNGAQFGLWNVPWTEGEGGGISGFTGYGAFLRPGEIVEEVDEVDNPQGGVIEHFSRPFTCEPANAPRPCPGRGWPALGDSWASILRKEPLEVVLQAIFDPVFPGLSEFRITGRAAGFRQIRAFSSAPPASTATATPAPTSTSTPIPPPSPTPTVTPTATVTATPTATGTLPTPTATATSTHTPTPTPSPTPTPTVTGTLPTATPTGTPTVTPTATSTPTVTPTPTPTTNCQTQCSSQAQQARCRWGESATCALCISCGQSCPCPPTPTPLPD